MSLVLPCSADKGVWDGVGLGEALPYLVVVKGGDGVLLPASYTLRITDFGRLPRFKAPRTSGGWAPQTRCSGGMAGP